MPWVAGRQWARVTIAGEFHHTLITLDPELSPCGRLLSQGCTYVFFLFVCK